MHILRFVGSSPETQPVIEASFLRLLPLLERMLKSRPYLLGWRPGLADFGLAGQLAQLLSDPTPGALLREHAPSVVRWIARMDAPRVEGDFAALDEVQEDLAELLRTEVAAAYLPWMDANARAVAEEAPIVRVEIEGRVFTQKPQRYAAKALSELRRKRELVAGEAALGQLLTATGCDTFLAPEVDEAEASPSETESVD